jgi:phosphatidylglycerophosphatase A
VKRLIGFLATLGPVGYFPIAPASAASLVTALVAWFLPVPALPIALGALALGTAVAVWICGEAEKELGHDAHPIVADEVIGQSLALLGAPHAPAAFFVAFLLFRVFDVWKPLGAREAQALPGGVGVVADDVIAGLTSCLVLQLGLWGLARAGVTMH